MFDFEFDFDFDIIYSIHLHVTFTYLFAMMFILYVIHYLHVCCHHNHFVQDHIHHLHSVHIHYSVTVVVVEDFEKLLYYNCAISKCFAELLSNNFQYLFSQSLCNHSAMFYNDCTIVIQLLQNSFLLVRNKLN